MAKIQISESKLKEIIRECVEKAVNEDVDFQAGMNQNMQQGKNPANEPIGPGPSVTRGMADARNAEVNNALNNWNKLGTYGQIKKIQELVGATPDGRLGPETLGKIYVALSKKDNPLSQVTFKSGKRGTYTNI